jgi:hypothetical protein
MDLRDTQTLDAVWPIISNKAAIAVNQQFDMHSRDAGRLHNSSTQVQ